MLDKITEGLDTRGHRVGANRSAQDATTALETRHLTRTVLGKVLLGHIGVQMQQGEVLAVVGPSGGGKSSFLRLLNRLDEPTSGTVLLNGQDYRATAPRELRKRIGMVARGGIA